MKVQIVERPVANCPHAFLHQALPLKVDAQPVSQTGTIGGPTADIGEGYTANKFVVFQPADKKYVGSARLPA